MLKLENFMRKSWSMLKQRKIVILETQFVALTKTAYAALKEEMEDSENQIAVEEVEAGKLEVEGEGMRSLKGGGRNSGGLLLVDGKNNKATQGKEGVRPNYDGSIRMKADKVHGLGGVIELLLNQLYGFGQEELGAGYKLERDSLFIKGCVRDIEPPKVKIKIVLIIAFKQNHRLWN